jgi:hypothetical protein
VLVVGLFAVLSPYVVGYGDAPDRWVSPAERALWDRRCVPDSGVPRPSADGSAAADETGGSARVAAAVGALARRRCRSPEHAADHHDTTLLCTDGPIERRGSDGTDWLGPSLGAVDGAAGVDPAELLARLRPANPGDDTCVLALRPRS